MKTHFAPSHTGAFHIGDVRKALFSWLHVHANEEHFILPIEDTDRQRSTQAAIRVILYGMRWLS